MSAPCRWHPEASAQLAQGQASQTSATTGGSGWRLYNGLFLKRDAEIDEELGYGTPWGDAGIYWRMLTRHPVVMLAYRLFAAMIRSLNFDWRYETPGAADAEILDRARRAYFDDLSNWDRHIAQACRVLVFGFMDFEVETKIARDGALVPSRFLPRMPFSIYQFVRENERLKSITQYVQRDKDVEQMVEIPAERVLHYVREEDGDHFTGLSLFRPAYGYVRAYEDVMRWIMMRLERMASGTPAAGVDNETWGNAVAMDDMASFLENFRSGSHNFVIFPRGADGQNSLEWLDGDFKTNEIVAFLQHIDWLILASVTGQMMALGTTSFGSRSLGDMMARFFTSSLTSEITDIVSPLNDTGDHRPTGSVGWFVDSNFGPQAQYPTLHTTAPRAESLSEFATALQVFKGAGFLQPMADDHRVIRDLTNLPQMTADDIKRVQESVDKLEDRLPSSEPSAPPATGDATEV